MISFHARIPSIGLTKVKPFVKLAEPMKTFLAMASPIVTVSRNAEPETPPVPYPTPNDAFRLPKEKK